MDEHARGISRNGLRVDAAKQREWQHRGAKKYAAKRRTSRNKNRMTAAVKPRPNDWSTRVRGLGKKRSQGFCEIGGRCRATHLHHRKFRRFGDHRIQNALHVCGWHHAFIHGDNGGSIAASRDAGWIVRGHADPATIPVLIACGARVLLDGQGCYQDAT